MKYIIYCRKSSDSEDRQVQSLESQEKEMRHFASIHNLEVVDVFTESMSAKSEGRPVFTQVLNMLQSGKANALICWKLDRLARNFIDGGKVIDLLQKSIIKEIRTFEGIHLPNDNVLMIAMQFGMANQYSRDLSANVKRGNRTKLERGEWPGPAPFGYLNDKAVKTIILNKKTSKYVLRAFELYATGGYTLKEVSDILYKDGLRTSSNGKIHKSKIHNFFTNKFYCGIMERDSKLYIGNHTPIITSSLFDQVQDVLTNRKHPRPKKHFYSARGFLRCGCCNCALTGDTKKGYIYYYCTNGKGNCQEHKTYMRSEYIHGLLSNLFSKLEFDTNLIEIMARAYLEKNRRVEEYIQSSLEVLTNGAKSLLEKELALVEGFSTGLIREEAYRLKIKDIERKRIEYDLQLKEIKEKRVTSLETFEQVKQIFMQANRASQTYFNASEPEKRNILQTVLSNTKIKNQNIVSYQFKSPYNIIANTTEKNDLRTRLALWDDIAKALIINQDSTSRIHKEAA